MTRVIRLAHGAGGPAMRALIGELTAGAVRGRPGDVGLDAMDDGAALRLGDEWLIVSTDSHVVKPLFFPGGDIGRLAVAGTVNDLTMMGATRLLGLTSALIVEEGLPVETLERVMASMWATCREVGVPIVTGDTKVMGKGELDGLAINTTGLGLAPRVVRDSGLRPGDRLIVTGTIGDHGFAILEARRHLGLEGELVSDVAPLFSLIAAALGAAGEGIVALKDPTRGGLASALHELAERSGVGIVLVEADVPIRPATRAAGELLGIDPLTVANEGKAVVGVRPEAADAVLAALRAHPLGARAAIVGEVVAGPPGRVVLDTGFGRRLLVEADGELLPRIC